MAPRGTTCWTLLFYILLYSTAHDENWIIKAELKAALSLAHELRGVAEDAERRSRLASERAEAHSATLTEVSIRLDHSQHLL